MTLVAHSSLPSFAELQEQGHELLTLDRAKRQDIRELHIGFLNMMPDTALRATERQFIRLVGNCNRIAQFFVYPFSLPELERGDDARDYIRTHYSRFDDLREHGLDAMIVTGANVANPNLDEETFWAPLQDVMAWADENVASTLCSCLATHAVLQARHGVRRQPLPEKRWGVFSHRLLDESHPLVRGINTRFDVPHSRHNDISQSTLEAAGLKVLAASDDGGVHLAVSPDRARVVYFQGHPEYDRNSLLKEYKREVLRFTRGERTDRPDVPVNYLSPAGMRALEDAWAEPGSVAARLEELLTPHLENTWGDTAKAVFNNWLGFVYQITNLDRRQQFMPGVDPDDPLGLRRP